MSAAASREARPIPNLQCGDVCGDVRATAQPLGEPPKGREGGEVGHLTVRYGDRDEVQTCVAGFFSLGPETGFG
jgi:hypothetical protein